MDIQENLVIAGGFNMLSKNNLRQMLPLLATF
jgi:hypothetical protein